MQNDLAVKLHTVEQDFQIKALIKEKKKVFPFTHFSIPTLKKRTQTAKINHLHHRLGVYKK